MVLKSARFIRREVEETDALIRSAGHSGEIYFRPPYGHKFVMLPWYLWRTGRTTVTWDIEPDSYPDVASSASSIVAHVGKRVRPGSIILLHIWFPARRTSLDAVPDLIDEVEKQGFRFVTLSELLREKTPNPRISRRHMGACWGAQEREDMVPEVGIEPTRGVNLTGF